MRCRFSRQIRGLTLIEAMLLLVIMSIVAVATGVGLQAVAKAPVQTDTLLAVNSAMVDTLEQWKAKSWATMNPSSPFSSPYSVSDTVIVGTTTYSRSVFVTDADPSSPESGGTPVTDFRRITVIYTPQISGSPAAQLAQRVRCYVTKPN